MVVLDMHKDISDGVASTEHISLREERKRTGRYVAAGAAIFLSLLGVYQALIQGTPEYAALFAPAVIMFVYVLWILYASRDQHARLRRKAALEAAQKDANSMDLAKALSEKVDNEEKSQSICVVVEKDKVEHVCDGKQYNRSYSIA